ncbi:hypothetical protein CDAR_76721 [Caerostris darwini]|uniref:Uncharacterized protein n=1 Tax=Caerostris darwini TaxID=1538125 RepID=A0AAV4QBP4_9ARAC|nr:hypothetical protein CDAR_76721 [Caerostris darwini]
MPDERRVPLLRDRRNKNTSNRFSGLMQQHRRVLILCCLAGAAARFEFLNKKFFEKADPFQSPFSLAPAVLPDSSRIQQIAPTPPSQSVDDASRFAGTPAELPRLCIRGREGGWKP